MSLRYNDLHHKMLNQITVLLTTKFQASIEKLGGESLHAKRDKKVQMLNQALVISKWIESFDTSNINDFYFSKAQKVNPKQMHDVQMQFREALNEMDVMNLSTHNKGLGTQIQNLSSRLNVMDKTMHASPSSTSLKGAVKGGKKSIRNTQNPMYATMGV